MQIIGKKIIEDCSGGIHRAGEGSSILLKDGRILFVYNRFASGGEDFDPAELYGGILNLETGKIENPKVYFPCPGACNQMSANFERMPDGSIAFAFGRKSSPNANEIFFTRSYDEGESWTPLVNVSKQYEHIAPYWILNNDRLRVLSHGRLAIPVCIHYDGLPLEPDAQRIETHLANFISDDEGKSWRLTSNVPVPETASLLKPHKFAPGGEELFRQKSVYPYRFQEPGIELLADGRVLIYCRTYLGYMYQAYSEDNGETFSPLEAAKDLISPCGPQSIRREPGGKRLYCVYNDHRQNLYGEENWQWRTPLSLAISDDHGASYQYVGEIEDNTHNYCYTSMTFLPGKQLLLTNYESENFPERRRNLASLKMQLLAL